MSNMRLTLDTDLQMELHRPCHYYHAAEATHCILYNPRAMAYRAADVTGDPPGPRAHVPYACGPCAEARRDELDAKDTPAVTGG